LKRGTKKNSKTLHSKRKQKRRVRERSGILGPRSAAGTWVKKELEFGILSIGRHPAPKAVKREGKGVKMIMNLTISANVYT